MKNKASISEVVAGGTMSQIDTSTTTSPSTNKKSISIKKKDLTDPNVQNYLNKAEDADVTIVDEDDNMKTTNDKLTYLSNIKDDKGQISKPFSIGDKRFQVVRVLTPTREKGLGVYALDETDENGENIIYDMKVFEETIANKAKDSQPTAEPEVMGETEEEGEKPSFAGYKHFIVNKKTGKARKFKTIEELAKAQMSEDEQYMGMKSFRKFVDESLFGQSKKRSVSEVEAASPAQPVTTPMGEPTPELQQKAEQLMDLIKERIPESIFKTIVSPLAKREVIASFAELIGVPRNGLNTLLAGIKALSKKTLNQVAENEK